MMKEGVSYTHHRLHGFTQINIIGYQCIKNVFV